MRFAKHLIVAASLLASTPAWALFDAQLLLGKRSGELVNKDDSTDKTSLDGTEVQAAFHIDPIPLVPVAFGVYASQQTYEPKEDEAIDKITGLEVGLQVYAWFPLSILSLKPFAKVGIPVYSAEKVDIDVDGTKASTVFTNSGLQLGVGLAYGLPVLPVSLLLELDMGRQEVKSEDVKINGTKIPGTDAKFTYNSTAILFGVQAGI